MIDLSSDTATRPTQAMRSAIAAAAVGDEQRLEDPTVTALIEAVCDRLGKPAGLFLPSGTMCNVIAVKTHTQPGDAVFVGHNCHILRCETGGAAAFSGVVLDVVPSDTGLFKAAQLQTALYQRNPYTPNPRLVCVEQTHNFAGGALWPLDQLRAIKETAKERGLSVHMDGARLFNAVVALGVPAREVTSTVDSVWVDFTKGLGAPLGAVLCGEVEFIEKARRYKHMLGGALRQAGMMAAGCLYALEHHVERLADDHRRAKTLAERLASYDGFEVTQPDTNIVFFRPGHISIDDYAARLEDHGVRMSWVGDRMRAVTHLDVSEEDIQQSLKVLDQVQNSFSTANV